MSTNEILDRLAELAGGENAAVAWATGLLALLGVVVHGVWRYSRNVVTIAHEGGHALFALLSGRRLSGVRLHSDTSGVTVSAGRPTGPGMVVTAFAGYVTPSLLGLGAAALASNGQVRLLLWISIGFLAAMLVVIRNVFGVISVVATGAIVFVVSFYADPPWQAAFASLFSWFLLLGGVKPVGELQRKRRRGRAPDSDADQLARLTRVPGLLWVALFGAISLGALFLGGGLLLSR
ncbi:M50 family metallopeptidase [Umezawaea beigongshangensis]|uniref:M50 family metallopeptidase n=1 Tax=Umezawaea beigongshangensis TaxID=2780383 RepID=UPI0027DD3597|nr:M50 family metallopeptidase [Umezawaea beigongshangensis]